MKRQPSIANFFVQHTKKSTNPSTEPDTSTIISNESLSCSSRITTVEDNNPCRETSAHCVLNDNNISPDIIAPQK